MLGVREGTTQIRGARRASEYPRTCFIADPPVKRKGGGGVCGEWREYLSLKREFNDQYRQHHGLSDGEKSRRGKLLSGRVLHSGSQTIPCILSTLNILLLWRWGGEVRGGESIQTWNLSSSKTGKRGSLFKVEDPTDTE